MKHVYKLTNDSTESEPVLYSTKKKAIEHAKWIVASIIATSGGKYEEKKKPNHTYFFVELDEKHDGHYYHIISISKTSVH